MNVLSSAVPPRLKLTEDSDDDSSGSVEVLGSSMQRAAESVVEPGYWPRALDDASAEIVVSLLWLAQEMCNRNARFYLVVGGDVQYPQNQQGTIERAIYATIPVEPVLDTLCATRFSFVNPAEFRLRCQFVVGSRDAPHVQVPASTVRVPYPLQREGAIDMPWAAYNSKTHTDAPRPGDNRRSVMFIDKPNVAMYGDRFFLSTTGTSEQLNQVGTSPNDDTTDIDRSRAAAQHFYDDFFVPAVVNETADNMHGEQASQVASDGTSVNIVVSNGNSLTAARWSVALREAKQHLTTAVRINAAVARIVLNGATLV